MKTIYLLYATYRISLEEIGKYVYLSGVLRIDIRKLYVKYANIHINI